MNDTRLGLVSVGHDERHAKRRSNDLGLLTAASKNTFSCDPKQCVQHSEIPGW